MDYTVTREGDLYVVHGAIPIADSECLGNCWALSLKSVVHDWHLADALGASMVVGTLAACNERRASLGIAPMPDPTGKLSMLDASSDQIPAAP